MTATEIIEKKVVCMRKVRGEGDCGNCDKCENFISDKDLQYALEVAYGLIAGSDIFIDSREDRLFIAYQLAQKLTACELKELGRYLITRSFFE